MSIINLKEIRNNITLKLNNFEIPAKSIRQKAMAKIVDQ